MTKHDNHVIVQILLNSAFLHNYLSKNDLAKYLFMVCPLTILWLERNRGHLYDTYLSHSHTKQHNCREIAKECVLCSWRIYLSNKQLQTIRCVWHDNCVKLETVC